VLKTINDEMHLLHMNERHRAFAPELQEIYKQEYAKAFLAELNSVYVALTRAQQELYIFIPKKSGKNNNIVSFLILPEMFNRGGQSAIKSKNKDLKLVMALNPAKPRDWIDFLKDEFLDKDRAVYRQQILQGELLHNILSNIKKVNSADLEMIVKSAVEKTAQLYPRFNLGQQVAKEIHSFINASDIKGFFYLDKEDVLTEQEIVDSSGHTKRIDRLIILKEEVWVIDFKSQLANTASYVEQIRGYKALLKPLYPLRQVRGFLISLDDKNVEEVKG
jgi:ATP-dependent exoDNAse (exonuclease V) beta subunit